MARVMQQPSENISPVPHFNTKYLTDFDEYWIQVHFVRGLHIKPASLSLKPTGLNLTHFIPALYYKQLTIFCACATEHRMSSVHFWIYCIKTEYVKFISGTGCTN
jgi:hypothetical protein